MIKIIGRPIGNPRVRDENLDHHRIELFARLPLNLGDGLHRCPSVLVRPDVRQGIKDIGERHDPARLRDFTVRNPTRVALTVPAFMVRQGDQVRQLHQFRLAVLEHSCPLQRVRVDDVALVGGQRAGFVQDLIGNCNLADVMQTGGLPQEFNIAWFPTEPRGELGAQVADALGVFARVGIAEFGSNRQALDHLDVRGLQFVGARLHQRLEFLVFAAVEYEFADFSDAHTLLTVTGEIT